MSNVTRKEQNFDGERALRGAFNPEGRTLGVDGFIVGKVGHKIEVAYPTATTETYTYYDETLLLCTIQVTYTDSTKENLSSVERTA